MLPFCPFCFLLLCLSSPPAVCASLKLHIRGRQLLVGSALFFPERAYTRGEIHTYALSLCMHRDLKKKKKKNEVPFVYFLTQVYCAAEFYWWLPIPNSKVSLSFDLLICIGSLSQRDSVYQCPQAECQCLLSAYKYPADTVCHVYSWTSLTFDNTLDISHQNFTSVFF